MWWCCICLGGVFGALVMLELVGNTEAGGAPPPRAAALKNSQNISTKIWLLQGIDLANCISCGFLFACDQSRS